MRTLVFRGWGGPDQVDLLTDARSAKTPELEHQPAMEICWLMPKPSSNFGCGAAGSRLPVRRKLSVNAIGSSSARLGVPYGPGQLLAGHGSPVINSLKSSQLKPRSPNISSCCAFRLCELSSWT